MDKQYSNDNILWLFSSYIAHYILGGVIYLYADDIMTLSIDLLIFGSLFFLLKLTLLVYDRSMLKKLYLSDIKTQRQPPRFWTIFIAPIYLYQRAKFLKTNQFFFLLWFIFLALSILIEYLFSLYI